MNKRRLIATGAGNWDYYASTLKDGTVCVLYVAKEGSGAASGIFCAAHRLKTHFRHIANIKHGAAWESLVPDDWNIVDRGFFTALGIY